jgi:hypothetical protein
VKGSDVAGHVISPDEADALAARILGDRRTTLGELHISHARRVAAGLDGSADDRLVAAALLHDVLEKTAVTAEELRAMTCDAGCVDLVEVLTQAADESDESYLARCVADPAALRLKRLDLMDKFVADTSGVPATLAASIRSQALARLALLDLLAERRAR